MAAQRAPAAASDHDRATPLNAYSPILSPALHLDAQRSGGEPDYRLQWSDPSCRWVRTSAGSEAFSAVSVTAERPLTLLLPEPPGPTCAIDIRLATWARRNTCALICELYDEGGVRLDRRELAAETLRDGDHHRVAELSDAVVPPGRPLELRLSSPDGSHQDCVAVWVRGASAPPPVDHIGAFRTDRFFTYDTAGASASAHGPAVLALPASTQDQRDVMDAVMRVFPKTAIQAVGADDQAELWRRASGARLAFLTDAVQDLDGLSFALHRRGVCSVFVETADGWEAAPLLRPAGALAETLRDRAALRRRCRFTLSADGRLVDNAPAWADGGPNGSAPAIVDPRRAGPLPPRRLDTLLHAVQRRYAPRVTVVAKAPRTAVASAALIDACFAQAYAGPIVLLLIGGDQAAARVADNARFAGPRQVEVAPDADAAIGRLGHLADTACGDDLAILCEAGRWSPVLVAAHAFEHADGGDVAVVGDLLSAEGGSTSVQRRDPIQAAGFLNCTAANLSFPLRSIARFADLITALASEDAAERTRLELRTGFDAHEAGVTFRQSREARLAIPPPEPAPAHDPIAAADAVGRERPLFPLLARRWLSGIAASSPRRLNIVTYRWHAPHQYELYKLPHQFTLATGVGANQFIDQWPSLDRPLRPNAQLKPAAEIDPGDYDLAILHFDEHACAAHLSNGRLGAGWGDPFAWLLSTPDIPKIAICHGTPPFVGQFAADAGPIADFIVHDAERRALVELLAAADVKVVCNSHQALAEWGFRDARVIWHGFEPQEWPRATYRRQVLALEPDLQRPHYRGAFECQAVIARLAGRLDIGAPQQPTPALEVRDTQAYAERSFRAYVEAVRPFSAYLNTTRRSPMPRSRGEAMIMGITPVCLRNHDVDRFVDNGVNGFYAEEPDELASFLEFLFRDPDRPRRLGAAARATALDLFNHDRYLQSWTALIAETI